MGLRPRLLLVMLGLLLVAQMGVYLAMDRVIADVADALGAGYARQYALANRALLQEPLVREIALARQLAASPVIRAWAGAENDPAARERAYAELESYRTRFIDRSWFYVVNASLRYYFDDDRHEYGESRYAYTIERGGSRDAWYFATLAQVPEYALNVNYDQVLDVTKVWINMVVRDAAGAPLAMTGTGIDLTVFVRRFVDSPDPGSQNVVLDRSLAIQAHHDRSLIDMQSLVRDSSERITVSRLVDGPPDMDRIRQGLERLQDGATVSTFRVSTGGKPRLVGATYLADLSWYVLTFLDLGELIGRRLLGPVAVLGLVALALLAVAGAWVVNRSVFRPVMALTEAAESMARGVYQPPRLPRRRDEIGKLAEAFANMADSVRINTETLESRVRERTTELDQSNRRLADLNRALEEAATTDLQTGLLNRRGIRSRLAEEIERVTRGVSTVCLMLLDLDHFKRVNDDHGHDAGDRTLVAAAQALKASVRSYDLCARWGGEEFLIVAPGLDRDGALSLAEKLRQVVARIALTVPALPFAVTASIGVCLVEPGESSDRAVARADRALYRAKAEGRDRWVLADPAVDT